jgi:undecaprenyl-phosphate 4-deoxy-4-formamido-L-arabinose transferase
MPEQSPQLSVIVPVYNEQETIVPLLQRLHAVLQKLGRSYEILLVDDGSTDRGFELVRQSYGGDEHVVVVHLTKNFGQQQAVMAGFRECRGEQIVTIDADLQNPPEEIPRLLAKLDEGYDVVCGWRRQRHDPLLRKLSSLILNRIVSRLTRVRLHDYGCMLRAYRRAIIERVRLCPERSTYITALVCWVGGRFAEVEVAHAPRERGASKYSYFKLFELYFNLVTGFSILPLQLISFLGMACSVLGFGLGLWLILFRIVSGNDPGGVRSVFAVLFFLFGLLIFSLGLIGEYIGRIYIEVQARPGFLVRETVKLGKVQAAELRADPQGSRAGPEGEPSAWTHDLETQLQTEPR